MISSIKSPWMPVSGVPKRSIQGPMVFNIFLNDRDDRTECSIRKFGDDTKLRGVADTPEGCAAIQRHLERLEKQATKNLMKFSKVLPLGRNYPRHQYTLRANWLENKFCREGPLGPGEH